jgi:post-segregation antitoxin (ccd killing protein)
MAKFTPGPTIGAASGSVGGTVYSRNRYGAYLRNRAVPVTSTTQEALNAKGRLAAQSEAWRALNDEQRAAWNTYTQTNPVTGPLGMSQVLTGHAAYVGINARLARAGDTLLSLPPVSTAPTALATLSATYDVGAGTTVLTFTATPLAAGVRLWVKYAVVDSTGINYVENLFKLCTVTSAAQATGYDYESDVEARFGTLSVGQKLVIRAHTFDGATGLLSAPLQTSGVIVST